MSSLKLIGSAPVVSRPAALIATDGGDRRATVGECRLPALFGFSSAHASDRDLSCDDLSKPDDPTVFGIEVDARSRTQVSTHAVWRAARVAAALKPASVT